MKKLITISVIFVVIAACDISERVEADYRNVIPLPHEIVMVDGNSFVVEKDTRILYPEDNVLLERNAQFLAGYIEETTGRRLKVEPGQGGNDENVIMLGLDLSFEPWLYVAVFALIMICYFVINRVLVGRLKKMTPAEVLKNRE